MTPSADARAWPWVLGVMIASVGFALTPIFARLLGLGGTDAPTIVFYRYVLTAVLLSPFLLTGRAHFRLIGLGIAAGAGMGLGYIGYIRLLEQTTVATAGVIYLSYPVFALIFAWILLGLRPGPRGLTGVALVLGAGFVTASPDTMAKLTPELLLMGLAAPASFGLAITILTGWLVRLPPIPRLACVPFGAAIGLAPLVLADRTPTEVMPTAAALPYVLGLAIATALIPQLIYVVSAPRIGSVSTAIVGSVELPAMVLLGFAFFAERPTGRELLACALVVAAILLISISRQPKRRPAAV